VGHSGDWGARSARLCWRFISFTDSSHLSSSTSVCYDLDPATAAARRANSVQCRRVPIVIDRPWKHPPVDPEISRETSAFRRRVDVRQSGPVILRLTTAPNKARVVTGVTERQRVNGTFKAKRKCVTSLAAGSHASQHRRVTASADCVLVLIGWADAIV